MGNGIYLQRCRGMKEEVVSGKCKPPGSKGTFIGMKSLIILWGKEQCGSGQSEKAFQREKEFARALK